MAWTQSLPALPPQPSVYTGSWLGAVEGRGGEPAADGQAFRGRQGGRPRAEQAGASGEDVSKASWPPRI